MSDVDGDSTMHSSPELGVDDEMFPGEGPSTPRNAASYTLDPASDLSPPNSQGRPQEDSSLSALAGAPSMINANGKRTHPSAAAAAGPGAADDKSGPVHTDPATGYQWSKTEDQPGHEWKNSRAREEESRALETIVDRNLQIRTRYGDPLKR